MGNRPVEQHFSIPDELWDNIRPLLPVEPPKPKGRRPRMDDRKAMTAIFFILRTGIQWKARPKEIGAASTWQAVRQSGSQAVDGAMTIAPLGGKAWVPIRLTAGSLEQREAC